MPGKRIWKLYEDRVKIDFISYIKKFREKNQKDASVEGYWKVLIGALTEATDTSCGGTKTPARHRKPW